MFMTFEQWEKQVDIELEKEYGMGIDFLPDWNSYDAFCEGMNPKAAAAEWFADSQNY